MPGVGPALVQSRTFLVSGNLQVLDLPWKSFKNESEWEQSKFPWDREKERGQGVGERSNSRHLSAHRPTGKWVAHAISQFLGIFVSRRVVSQLCGTKSVSASQLGGVLFLKWSIPAVAWHLFPWAPPSTCGDRFHYNDDMMSFRLFLVSFSSMLESSGFSQSLLLWIFLTTTGVSSHKLFLLIMEFGILVKGPSSL